MDSKQTCAPPPSTENSKRPPGDSMVVEPLKASLDPNEVPEVNNNNNNTIQEPSDTGGEEGGDSLSVKVKETKVESSNVGTVESVNKDKMEMELQEIVKPLLVATSSEDLQESGDILIAKKVLLNEEEKTSTSNPLKSFIGSLYANNRLGIPNENYVISVRNNNNNNNNEDDRINLIPTSETKSYPYSGSEGYMRNQYWNWKREQRTNFRYDEERRRFPWKRITYICVLLVLGVTCAILALMKICGGADWMNTATFSVIMMGTCMLLPPGLYYGRILICICFYKEYSLWDVPAGPFG